MDRRLIVQHVVDMIRTNKGALAPSQAMFCVPVPGQPDVTDIDLALFSHAYVEAVRLHKAGTIATVAGLCLAEGSLKGTRIQAEWHVLQAAALLSLQCFAKPVGVYNKLIDLVNVLPARAIVQGIPVASVQSQTPAASKPAASKPAASKPAASKPAATPKLPEPAFSEPATQVITTAQANAEVQATRKAEANTEIAAMVQEATEYIGQALTSLIRQVLEVKANADKPAQPDVTPVGAMHSTVAQTQGKLLPLHGEVPLFPNGKPRNQLLHLSNREYAKHMESVALKAREGQQRKAQAKAAQQHVANTASRLKASSKPALTSVLAEASTASLSQVQETVASKPKLTIVKAESSKPNPEADIYNVFSGLSPEAKAKLVEQLINQM